MKIDTAVLPIAGLGTRFVPLSKVIPKEFFPLGSKPIIQYIVEEALEAGIKKIVFVISPEKKEIFEKYILKYFKEDPDLLRILKKRKKKAAIEALNSVPKISKACFSRSTQKIKYEYTVQQKPLGDGDAILKAEKFARNKPFLVLFGDDISFNKKGAQMATQLVKTFEKIQKPLLCLYRKPEKELFAYGVPEIREIRGRLVQIRNLIEKPKKNPPSNFAIVGKYILTPDIFFYLKKIKLHNGEIILANAIKEMIKDKKEVLGLVVRGKWLECGTREEWIKNFIFLAKNI